MGEQCPRCGQVGADNDPTLPSGAHVCLIAPPGYRTVPVPLSLSPSPEVQAAYADGFAVGAARMSEACGWIACSEWLPESGPIETFSGGYCSPAVLGLFPDDDCDMPPGLCISPCYYVRWDDHGEWMVPSDSRGGLERCLSHGGKAPTHWMPLPKAPTPEAKP